MYSSDILFDEIPGEAGDIGLITLNRPQALNALNHVMFKALNHHLQLWHANNSIKAVVIRATEGRAFCAGGDVKSIYLKKIQNDQKLDAFFCDEYAVNRLIKHFNKPYIALLDGITMGGGAGISIHGSHRIATERLTFAMPETTIGFFPDIGASYFLSRLPYKIGIYLALTGVQINYSDAFHLGLVDTVVSQHSQKHLIQALIETALPDKQAVTDVIRPFATPVADSDILKFKSPIEKCFSLPTVEDIIAALHQENEWGKNIVNIIEAKSPTSIKVTLQEMHRGAVQDFDICMDMEFRMMHHFLESHDFFEGVRALLVDKDKNPKWKPPRLSDVALKEVEKYF